MLKLYNTMSNTLEVFKPLNPKKVKMSTCGPSIYQMPHIGNYRTFVFEDILHRYLEYLGYDVQRILTITDIEDKALAESKKLGVPLDKLTTNNLKRFVEELKKLRVKIPENLQRSSNFVDQAVCLIEKLLELGYAYWHTHKKRRNVYFDTLKFDEFGKLFKLDMNDWPKKKRRFHQDTYPGRRWNRGDFILWHGYKEGDIVYWDTRIGRGRPSWNIQDPSMIPKKFNFKVDIWCSGIDSTYRHHDYIIAIVESITGERFVNYWLHSAHLIFEGEKMSKRKGNIKYPRTLLETECIWNHIRFFFIYGHYRKKLNFTFNEYNKACKLLKNFREMIKKITVQEISEQKSNNEAKKLVNKIKIDFEKNMNNDLQLKAAFDSLYNTLSRLVILNDQKKVSFDDLKKVLKELKLVDSVFQVLF